MLVSGEKTLLIDNLSHADGAKGAEIYLHREYTEFHRIIGSTYLHGTSLTQRRKGARRFICTRNALNDTEFCSAGFCEDLRRLRETIPLRMVLCIPCIPVWNHLTHTTQTLCETLRLCVRRICSYVLLSKRSGANSVYSVSTVWE